jgi:hypothetical protein
MHYSGALCYSVTVSLWQELQPEPAGRLGREVTVTVTATVSNMWLRFQSFAGKKQTRKLLKRPGFASLRTSVTVAATVTITDTYFSNVF